MLILSNEDIEKILPVGTCIDVLEEAYRDLGNGMAATVPRYDVFSPTKPDEFYEYKTMSGVLPGRNIAALRLNSSVVKWYEKAGGIRKDKLAVAGGDKYVGLVMLFSTETGEPLAIFPDGYVQKLRVAGASAIAARYLARKDAQVMALLGAGWQASAHLVTMSMIRDLKQVKVFSPTPESRRRFVEEWSGKVSARLIDAGSAAEAMDGADMVICTTTMSRSGDRFCGVPVSINRAETFPDHSSTKRRRDSGVGLKPSDLFNSRIIDIVTRWALACQPAPSSAITCESFRRQIARRDGAGAGDAKFLHIAVGKIASGSPVSVLNSITSPTYLSPPATGSLSLRIPPAFSYHLTTLEFSLSAAMLRPGKTPLMVLYS